ncbi:orexin receptor type 2-like [Saccostrea echinata]|uniref:orexin receptor type 2-like n=1 Tax=Saccostrea echinata TaxID=191078 RepID=UPI002A7FBB0E|nr:orexin receptor type 2-like [Saccostrea echinata]
MEMNASTLNFSIILKNSSHLDPYLLLKELNDKAALRYLPVIIFLFVLMICGIIGNILVCIVYLKKKTKLSPDYFILTLAFLDLLTCIIGIPVEIADLRYPYMFYAPAACKLLRTIESLSAMGSALTLVAISIDRFKRICRLGQHFNNSTVKKLCVGAIVMGAVIGWPAAVVFGRKTVDVGLPDIKGEDCSTADEMRDTIYPLLYYSTIMLCFVVSVIFVIFVYVRISIFIRKGISLRKNRASEAVSTYSMHVQFIHDENTSGSSPSQAHPMLDATPKNRKRQVNSLRVTRTTTIFVAVTVAFILSYLPFLVIMIIRNVKKDLEDTISDDAEVVYKFFLKSYFVNNAINPLIYSFLNKRFRTDVKKLFSCNR